MKITKNIRTIIIRNLNLAAQEKTTELDKEIAASIKAKADSILPDEVRALLPAFGKYITEDVFHVEPSNWLHIRVRGRHEDFPKITAAIEADADLSAKIADRESKIAASRKLMDAIYMDIYKYKTLEDFLEDYPELEPFTLARPGAALATSSKSEKNEAITKAIAELGLTQAQP